ncbi:serine hydrolase domain-containing protein [Mesorhizobium comanense]|uniref:serine hydrolase domain-containing protein n=1 Tax=Mesorhizobium comanense TaxID=2502215 RepID=UPI001E5D6FDB|nr:serine hydrolase [Mesorhizobium comanense]
MVSNTSDIANAADWQVVAPGAAGFKSDPAASFDELAKTGKLAGVHGVVALRGGRIAFERYMDGNDMRWGQPLENVAFGPETLHDVRSVTKSIVGLLYGIALARGQVPGLDEPVVAQFPQYPDLAGDPQRKRLSIRHALTMTLGMEWNENAPYTDPANSEIAMEQAPDRYRFILNRPILAEPGKRWIYSGGAVALLGKIIERGTGQSLPEFARGALFDPLGIKSMDWIRGQDGEASAASGLRLSPRSLARIGQMILQGGQWEGRPVVPKSWLEQSFQPTALVDIGWPGMHYGCLWYLGEEAITDKAGTYGERFVAAFGNGGQRLFVFPGLDFVLAITTGNYNSPDQWRAPAAILYNVFLPSLTGS